MDIDQDDLRLGRRIKGLRQDAGLTLDDLAARSGVSRAMISKIERGESSPTAALLNRLAAALGVPLSGLFPHSAAPVGRPVLPRADQPLWRDPGTGYLRRNLSPRGTGSAMELIEIEIPPRSRVVFDNFVVADPPDRQVWVLEGTLEISHGDQVHRLERGDCLAMRLEGPITYANPGDVPVRYLIVTAAEKRHG